VECGACGAHSPSGKRFCLQCGAPLAQMCSECGAPVVPGARFCGDCGAALTVDPPSSREGQPAATGATSTAQPVAERRMCSVLFCDLVGFTPLSESRDPEEVRELLSRYFGAAEAAWALEDDSAIESLIRYVAELPPVEATPLMRGEAARFAGLLAAKRGDLDAASERFDEAFALLRELGYRFELAKALLDRGEVLQRAGRPVEATPFIDEARATFAELRARPLLERPERALARPASAA